MSDDRRIIRLVCRYPLSARIQCLGKQDPPPIDPYIDVPEVVEIAELAHTALMRAMAEEPRPYERLAIVAGFVAYANMAATFQQPKLGRNRVLTVDGGDPLTFMDVPLYLDDEAADQAFRVVSSGQKVVDAILRRLPSLGK